MLCVSRIILVTSLSYLAPIYIVVSWYFNLPHQNTNTPCRQGVSVCGFNVDLQENWLITQRVTPLGDYDTVSQNQTREMTFQTNEDDSILLSEMHSSLSTFSILQHPSSGNCYSLCLNHKGLDSSDRDTEVMKTSPPPPILECPPPRN